MLIAAMGIPGSGKSSAFKELALKYNIELFEETKEKDWPKLVETRNETGYFTALSWFRSARVPSLFEAKNLSDQGKTVLIDSYYDKLIYGYIEAPGMEWLIPKDDPYYGAIKEVAKIDYKRLPDADVVIGFRLNQDIWLKFLENRGRILDKDNSFVKQCFASQKNILEVSKQYAENSGKVYIEVEQEFGSPQKTAVNLERKLLEAGIRL